MDAHRTADALNTERVPADRIRWADQRLQANITRQLLVDALTVVVQVVAVCLVDLPAGLAEDFSAMARPGAHFVTLPMMSVL